MEWILTENHHKQQVWKRGVTSLLVHDGGESEKAGTGSALLVWWRCAAPQNPSRLYDLFLALPPPRAWTVAQIAAVAATLCHVSSSCPASGTTNTVMSSPEPSFSLGNRQPRSLSTPRDLISRSWAARVYLRNTREQQPVITAIDGHHACAKNPKPYRFSIIKLRKQWKVGKL